MSTWSFQRPRLCIGGEHPPSPNHFHMFNVASIRPSKSGKGLIFETAAEPVPGSKIKRVRVNYAYAEIERGTDLQALASSLDPKDFKVKDVVDGLGELVEL